MGGRPVSLREGLTAALFALACLAGTLAAWSAFGGALPFGPKGYRVTVGFPDARTLVPEADVRIAGVPVGTVVAVRAGEDSTVATLELDAPLRADARALLRTKTPLGESYVAIAPGSPDAPLLADGGEIAARRVVPTQQVEDVLSTFDPRTRRALQRTLRDVAATLDGQGGVDLNRALGASGPTAESVGVVLDALDAQEADVRRLVDRTGTALDAIARRPEQLRELVRTGDAVLATTAERRTALTATVAGLERLTTELGATNPALRRTLAQAAPTVRVLAPVAPLVAPALRAVRTTGPTARRTLRRLPRTLALAERALPAATRLLPEVGRLSTALDATGRVAIPTVELLAAYAGDLVQGGASLAGATQAQRGTGQGTRTRYSRSAIHLTSEGYIGFPQRAPTNRNNPYPAPGKAFSGESFDCSNVGNPQPVPPAGPYPGCATAAPWTFRGLTRQFPRLDAYDPAEDR